MAFMKFSRTGLTIALTVFFLFAPTTAIPLEDRLGNLTPEARDLLKRSTPATPRFVVYDDTWIPSLPSPAELKGYNVYVLSFWMTTGPADMALQWQTLSENQRSQYLSEYNTAGISLFVSAFGETDKPTSSGADATTVANNLASWVREYGLQGVDIDYEDFNAFENVGNGVPWLVTLTRQLRSQLPPGQYGISHAPVAPWFSPNMWPGGGYLEVHNQVGSLIDWYNIQFYNQGTSEYTSCKSMLDSSSTFPNSALFQIAASGVDLNKLVIGKPAKAGDATDGYIPTGTLASCVAEAHERGWDAGVMVWEYPDASSSWITSVRGNTF